MNTWWYIPFALLVFVLVHVVVLGGAGVVAARLIRGRRAAGGARDPGTSIVLHRPRLCDWMVRVLTLGREEALRQWTLALGDLRPGSAVLDVGCGTGTLLLDAAERVGPSGAAHGIELSPEMRAHARHKAAARSVSLEVVAGSADSLPYPRASFDSIFCSLVLHHLPGPMREHAIREMRRVLRRGGRAVIVDWQRPASFARMITDPLSLVFLLHAFGPHASPTDVLDIEPLMTDLGFEGITRHSYRSGALGAFVGHLGAGQRAIDAPDMKEP